MSSRPAGEPVDAGHGDVVARVTLERVLPWSADSSSALLMDGELRYDRTDPFAVTLTIFVPGCPVAWTMARDLLLGGCYAPVGEGDVRVDPRVDADGRPVMLLELCSPYGAATLSMPSADVLAFCGRVLAVVPLGTETDYFDVDDLIDRLLQDA